MAKRQTYRRGNFSFLWYENPTGGQVTVNVYTRYSGYSINLDCFTVVTGDIAEACKEYYEENS